MSVVAPPEPPPAVQRPYDQGFTRRARRVSTYRRWTRVQQAGLAGMVVAAVALSVVTSALANVTWASSASQVTLTLLIMVPTMGAANTLLDRGGVRRALTGAEPLPDGAIELRMRPLGAILTEPRLLLIGALAGGGATLLALILGTSDVVSAVGALAGVCVGRMVSLEILLRTLVGSFRP